MEEKILKSFKKLMNNKYEGDVLVTLPDDFYEEYECNIMETRPNGRSWLVSCNENGNVQIVIEL